MNQQAHKNNMNGAHKQITDFAKQTAKGMEGMLGVLNGMLQNATKNMTPEQAEQISKALKDSKVLEAQKKANQSIAELNNYFDKIK